VARDALDRYKQRVVRGERSAATYRGIEVSLKSRILPFFGKLPIESIKVTTWFAFKEYVLKKYPHLKRGTLHQYKNALRVVLNDAYRHGIIKELPIFKDEYTGRRIEAPRPWFRPPEYKRLLSVIRKHRKHLSSVQPRWLSAVDELYDYVIWTTNTGCRVSEIANTRFCDVEVKLDKEAEREYLVIRNIKGKRGTGTCRSFFGATAAFKRRIEARKITEPQKSQEKLFLEHHRDMFKQILEKAKLRFSNTQPPAKRDFVSLRATYICFRLLNGVSVYEVANNCRTSVAMIETSYAKYLGGEILEGVNKIKGSLVGWDAKE
jgi:integrase